MFGEAAQAPEVVRAQLAANATRAAQLAERLRHSPPRAVVTCARGSSDHAASYGKYLIETELGRAVASVGPSIASVYRRPLELGDSLFVTVSQSGRSPDLLRLIRQRTTRLHGHIMSAQAASRHRPSDAVMNRERVPPREGTRPV